MTTEKTPNIERDDDLAVEEQRKTKRPRLYCVVFHNDDYTTMEFVVHVLQKFFKKTETEATHIMLNVHHRGFGVAAICSRDLAETQVARITDYAQQNGHPLRVTAEPEGFDE